MPSITIRTVIALLQGALLYLLYFTSQAPYCWPATQPYVFVPLVAVAIFIPLLVIQSIGNMRFKTLLRWTASATVILIGIAFYAVFRQLPASQMVSAFPFFSSFVFLFIAHSLILSSDIDRRFIANYPTYFDISWKLAVQMAFSAAFAVVFWSLLWLGAELFDVISLSFFKELIMKPWFAIPATTLVIAVALHITDVKAALINGIRTLILVLFSWLLPLITVIVGLFLLSLPFTGVSAFWKNDSGIVLLVAVAFHLILFINATYQDGQNNLGAIQRYSLRMASFLLTPIVIMTVCVLYSKVQQQGWLIQYFYAALCLLTMAFYATSYFLAALKNQRENKLFEMGNIITAYLILAIILAILTPLGDPARLTIPLELQSVPYPQAKPNVSIETKNKLIMAHTSDHKLPDDFIQQKWDINEAAAGFVILPNCLTRGTNPCQAWIINTPTQSPIIIMFDKNIFTGFQKNAQGVWSAIGNWIIPLSCQDKIQAVTMGQFQTVLPVIPDIEINGWRAHFTPRRDDFSCK